MEQHPRRAGRGGEDAALRPGSEGMLLLPLPPPPRPLLLRERAVWRRRRRGVTSLAANAEDERRQLAETHAFEVSRGESNVCFSSDNHITFSLPFF